MSVATRPATFADRLDRFGARPALLAEGQVISYADLARRVEERARALGPGRRLVMMSGGNDVETVVNYLGALRAGHVAWFVPKGAQDELIERFDPDVVATRCAGFPVIRHRRAGSIHRLHPDLALLLGTSGSTGAPRLVRLSHENLVANAAAIATYLGITPADRAATTLPPHYCYGLSVINSHLAAGGSLALTDASVADPRFWDLMGGLGVTSFAGVPHTFDLLDRIGFHEMDLPDLRYVTQAGGRLGPEKVQRFARLGARRGWDFVVMYGQTEATARMAYLPADLAARHPDSIGVPIPGGGLEIEPIDGGEPGVGELVYRGPNVMLGYADGPDDLERGREVHELRTGDLARRGPTGLYAIAGRRSRFLKLYGLRVDLDAAERRLAAMDVEALCAGSDDRLVVAVVGRPPPGLARTLAGDLGIPSAAVAVERADEAPRLPNGKPDYATVSAMAEPAGVGPDGAVQDDVAAVFRRVLDRDDVDGTDTFAGLGGDSMSYVEMSIALEELLGHLPDDWPSLTVDELSGLERRERWGAQVETNVVLRAGAILLVVASHLTAFWPAGGAHVLLALAGHSFARFQLAPGRGGRPFGAVGRIAVPSVAWIGLAALATGAYGVGAVVLVNNYSGSSDVTNGQWHFWFVEALVMILIGLAVLLAVPPVRQLERRRPYAFALGVLGIGLALRAEPLALMADDAAIFRPHSLLWLFALGWLVHRSTRTWQRVLTTLIVVASVPGFFPEATREAIVVTGLLALLWIPTVRVPRPAGRLMGVIAGASLVIYLTHWQVWPELAQWFATPAVFAGSIAVGVAIWFAVERTAGRIERRVRRRTAGADRVAAPTPRATEEIAADGRT